MSIIVEAILMKLDIKKSIKKKKQVAEIYEYLYVDDFEQISYNNENKETKDPESIIIIDILGG